MQHRLRDYKEDILSFDHNVSNLGLHSPGRYCGFDTIISTGNLTFDLYHSGTGISYKNPINTIIGPMGVVLSPQGTIIWEDEFIPNFSIDTNAGNAEIRYDLIVMTHNQVNITGGQPATYNIIKGPTGNPIFPNLVDPLKQIIIGILEVAANATTLTNVRYIKSKCPDSGDGEDARLSTSNTFKATQVFSCSATTYTTPVYTHVQGSYTTHLYEFEGDGNLFKLLPTGPSTYIFSGFKIKDVVLQDGARINILVNDKVTFVNSYYWIPTYANKGFKALAINSGMTNVVIPTGFGNLGLRPSTGENWELEFVLINDQWYLASIGGANSLSQFRRGMTVAYYGDLSSTSFDITGLGVNLMAGWAICNGLNGTDDLRGKILSMATTGIPDSGATNIITTPAIPEDYIYLSPYNNAGKKAKNILQAHIPNYSLNVNDPGHTHHFVGVDTVSTAAGGSSTRFCGNFDKVTSPDFTGITVNSAGGDQKFDVTPPVRSTVYLMKL